MKDIISMALGMTILFSMNVKKQHFFNIVKFVCGVALVLVPVVLNKTV